MTAKTAAQQQSQLFNGPNVSTYVNMPRMLHLHKSSTGMNSAEHYMILFGLSKTACFRLISCCRQASQCGCGVPRSCFHLCDIASRCCNLGASSILSLRKIPCSCVMVFTKPNGAGKAIGVSARGSTCRRMSSASRCRGVWWFNSNCCEKLVPAMTTTLHHLNHPAFRYQRPVWELTADLTISLKCQHCKKYKASKPCLAELKPWFPSSWILFNASIHKVTTWQTQTGERLLNIHKQVNQWTTFQLSY